MMKSTLRALRFSCQGCQLLGILSCPERPLPRGLLIVPDSAQTRSGRHRQFTLLAEALAARGIPVLRFDARGSGDSEGLRRAIDQMDDDLSAAIRAFRAECPSLRDIVLWGVGDGAAAAVLSGCPQPDVAGLVLVNPHIRTRDRQAGQMYANEPEHERNFWQSLREPRLGDLALSPCYQAQQTPQAALPRRVRSLFSQTCKPQLLVLDHSHAGGKEFAFSLLRAAPHVDAVDLLPSAIESDLALVTANWLTRW